MTSLILAISAPDRQRHMVLGATPGASEGPSKRVRRPVALRFRPDGRRLFVANWRSGSLSVINPATGRVESEADVGRGLADVATLADGVHLLAVDQEGDALLTLEECNGSIEVIERREVSPDPVGILVDPAGASCVVASLRSRRLTFFELARRGAVGPLAPGTSRTLDLPFSPRNMAMVREARRLVVTDAFGGKLAVVDPRRGTLESLRSLPAHNIRGLALAPDGESIAIAHQVLRRVAKTSFEDIHWGTLIRNQLTILRLDSVLAPGSDADLLRGSRLVDLGSSGIAAGDPAGIAFDRAGDLILALAGVDEVAIGRYPAGPFRRISVGRRPSAVLAGPDGTSLYVTDTLDDAITVLDVASGLWLRTTSLGPRPEPDLVAQGERLFSDARLSHDGWMSCQSCHTDGQSNGLTSDTLGDGSYGAPKRIPSLLGVGRTRPWMWDGSIERLEDQVRKSVETTMRGRPLKPVQVDALTAYLRSLAPPEPPEPRSDSDDAEAVRRGAHVFRTRKCARCHSPPEYTTTGRYDVGLADEVGNREFNPPSLRGVGDREPLLHDARARTLGEVFRRFGHPGGDAWDGGEVEDLIAFLKTL